MGTSLGGSFDSLVSRIASEVLIVIIADVGGYISSNIEKREKTRENKRKQEKTREKKKNNLEFRNNSTIR